jgi:capsular polysaccharide biosynthesis protein
MAENEIDKKTEGKPILNQDSLIMLAHKLYVHRKTLYKSAIIGAVLGVIFALGTLKTWTSTVVLAPEMASEAGLSGKMGSLASLAGINLGASSTDAIYPELYPQMIESTPFVVGLFDVQVTTLDSTVQTNLYDYIENVQKKSWSEYPIQWVQSGVRSIVSMFVTNPFKQSSDKIDPFYLSLDQEKVVSKVQTSMVSAFVNKSDQLITLSATTQDPLVSATLVDSVRERLQQEIIAYRTKKARHDMEYYQGLVEESRQEYKKLEQKYARYTDEHQNPFLTTIKAERDDLENQMQTAYNVYSQMVQQYEASKAKVQEATPSFTIIQPASISTKPSSTPKIVVALGWTFLFVFVTALWILVRDTLRSWVRRIKNPQQTC